MSSGTGRYVGVDGCRGGWIAVELGPDGSWRGNVYPDVQTLWLVHREAELILIDMPIGLAEGEERRDCDTEARQLLKPWRASSIFPAPARGVLQATAYGEANALSKSLGGRGLSRQSWALVPKIRELDELLQRDAGARERMREAHPELCFAGLAGAPMRSGKKTAEGFAERMELLRGACGRADEIVLSLLARYPRKEAARDDLVDALALAAAALCSGGRLSQVPLQEQRDGTGLPMRIAFYAAERAAAQGSG